MRKLAITLSIIGLTLQGYPQNSSLDVLSDLEQYSINETPNDTLDISYSDFQDIAEEEALAINNDKTPIHWHVEYKSDNSEEEAGTSREWEIDVPQAENDEEINLKVWYDDDDKPESDWNRNRKRFRGHWVGMGGGFSFYTIDDGSSSAIDVSYMTLNTNKSFSYQLNFVQTSIGLSRYFGFVSGLGLDWLNYRFEGNNSIQKNIDGPVSAYYLYDEDNNILDVKKSTFNVAYLTLPILAEVHFSNNWYLAGGPIGAMKIGSWTKMVLENGEKYRNESDFDLNMFMLGATLRVSYEYIQLYATSYYTPFCTSPLFKSTETPGGHKFYPIEIGLNIMF